MLQVIRDGKKNWDDCSIVVVAGRRFGSTGWMIGGEEEITRIRNRL